MNKKREDNFLNLTGFKDFSKIVTDIEDSRGSTGLYKEIGNQGLNINLNDLIYTSRGIYYLFPDRTIRKVLLYQGERHFRTTDKLDEDLAPTFHIYKCEMVKKHIEEKSKLFKITRRKDGYFLVKDLKFDKNLQRREEMAFYKSLICNSCFVNHGRIVRSSIPKEDFNIKDYLDLGHSDLTFSYNFDDIPIYYKNNWAEIATALKEKKNYTCEKCGIVVARLYAEKFLNIHYTAETIYTKTIDRVKVLCIRCHSEEPGHEFIREKMEYTNFFEVLLNKIPDLE